MALGSENFSIIESDACEGLSRLEDGEVDLLLTSPPYNIGKIYEKDGFPNLDAYADWMKKLISIASTKLSSSGSICWQVGNNASNGSIVPLDYIFFPLFRELGFTLRNRIIWTFNFGLHARQRLSGRYEVILWLTKSDDYKFNLDSIRVPQIYPGKRHAAGKSRSGPSGNPLGKNPSDVWTFDGHRFFEDELIWQIPNVKANHPEKTVHPCQFPSELAERCILAFTDPGDLVVDCFSGTGTTPIAAKGLNRRGLGFDLNPEYVAISKRRNEELENGTIRLRRSGQEPMLPRATERVSRIPDEWLSEAAE